MRKYLPIAGICSIFKIIVCFNSSAMGAEIALTVNGSSTPSKIKIDCLFDSFETLNQKE